jgi:hypothetical protein
MGIKRPHITKPTEVMFNGNALKKLLASGHDWTP